MAENGRDISEQAKTSGNLSYLFQYDKSTESEVDKELRLRNLKERQNEERHRKLEEIKAQALAAKRYKEQQEQERRRRLDEVRTKEDAHRAMVGERKKAINEAERDRLEAILRRNHEREARIEAKKRNERSSIVFAFGSSTPRMLDPVAHSAMYWGTRRATSTQNIPLSSASLTRRQSERDLDFATKKRATSAGGLERSAESSTPTTPAGCASGYTGRRRTDLTPTVITSRDSSFTSSRKSLNHSPGRAYSMTRLDQLSKPRKRPESMIALSESGDPYHHPSPRPLSTSSRHSSVTRSMSHLAVSKTGPARTAPGGPPTRKRLNKSDSKSMHQLNVDGSAAPRPTRATQLRQQKLNASSNNCSEASSRPSSSMSQQSTISIASSVSVRHRPSIPRKPRPASIAITGVTALEATKPPIPKQRKSISKPSERTPARTKAPTPKSPVEAPRNGSTLQNNQNAGHTTNHNNNNESRAQQQEQKQKPPDNPADAGEESLHTQQTINPPDNKATEANQIVQQPIDTTPAPQQQEPQPQQLEINTTISEEVEDPQPEKKDVEKPVNGDSRDFIEEERKHSEVDAPKVVNAVPKAEAVEIKAESKESSPVPEDTISNEMTASMTKSRINTEEEAKAALAERRRLAREEAERQAEQERLRIEAEERAEFERQQYEEEQIRLLIEQQKAAEEKRLQEAIAEAQKRDEEERLKREEEERLKQLKEETEKKSREEAERMKAELQQRLKNEEKEREMRRKRVEAIMSRTRGKANANSHQNSEDKNENKSENENQLNGTKATEENGTKNGKDVEIVDNIIPDESMKNANNVTLGTISSTDSINSNNSWQAAQQYDSLM